LRVKEVLDRLEENDFHSVAGGCPNPPCPFFHPFPCLPPSPPLQAPLA
jgi:hypothetical protein